MGKCGWFGLVMVLLVVDLAMEALRFGSVVGALGVKETFLLG